MISGLKKFRYFSSEEDNKVSSYSDKKELQKLASHIEDYRIRDFVENVLYTLNKMGKEAIRGQVYKKKKKPEEFIEIIYTQSKLLKDSLKKNFNITWEFPVFKERTLPKTLRDKLIINERVREIREGIKERKTNENNG